MGALWNIGGAAQGITQGINDYNTILQQKFQRDQQARIMQQQKEEDEDAAAIQGIKTRGIVDNSKASPGGMTGTADEQDWKAPRRNLSDSELANAVGRVQINRGHPQGIASGLQTIASGKTFDMQDYQMHQQKVGQVLMEAGRANAMGNPLAAAKILVAGHGEVFGGSEVQPVIGQAEDGSPTIALSRGGQMLHPPQPLTKDAIDQMLGKAINYMSPEMYQHSRQIAAAEKTAGATETSAGAHVTSAEAAKKNAETVAGLQASEIALREAQAGYYKKHGIAIEAAANRERNGPQSVIGQDDDGNVWVMGSTNGKIGLQKFPGPTTSDGKPLTLFPKITGNKPGAAAKPVYDFKPNPNGDGFLAVNRATGDVSHNIDAYGQALPIGMSTKEFKTEQAAGAAKGVDVRVGPDPATNVVQLQYTKGDKTFDNLKEAAKYKPPKVETPEDPVIASIKRGASARGGAATLPAVQEKLADTQKRLGMAGISDDTRARLQADVAVLTQQRDSLMGIKRQPTSASELPASWRQQ